MSVVNIFTAEYTLMVVTFIFSFLCLINVILLHVLKINEVIVYTAFGVESLALLAFFFISGIPNGFSALWICLIPSFALLIFGVKLGSGYSMLALLMTLFFFWIPAGKSLLMYSYTNEFMLRFPFLYCSVFVISLIIECVRKETQNQLEYVKQNYSFLYRHDALTGLYNRHGIKEYIEKAFNDKSGNNHAAIIIFDIDDFKGINDKYGHEFGDKVLKTVAEISLRIMCKHCHCCRWGGEEFLLIMQCEHNPFNTAEKIRKEVEKTEILNGEEKIHVTISVGVCVEENLQSTNIHDIIDKADKALYISKEKGKNCVTNYNLNL